MTMKKLLSLPPNLVDSFHDITGYPRDEYFCTCDPVGHKLGSGGGTAWLLKECHKAWGGSEAFDDWLSKEKRIILHAGGQSRRLPAYAPSGKVLTPVPVYRWERGQRLSQTLLDMQLPLYEKMMTAAPESLRTMIVSGDVIIRAAEQLPPAPQADVVCYGLWLDDETATGHGVFYSTRERPAELDHMLQKPSLATLADLRQRGYYLTDIGIWLLSDRAMSLLLSRSTDDGQPVRYDLYSDFGRALGHHPDTDDPELKALTVAIVPLEGGQFYHFGTSREMISSTLRLQNIVDDQREIIHRGRKPHPSIFVQNAITELRLTSENTNIWIENSRVPATWTVSRDNIITGVPHNNAAVHLAPGECIDIVPMQGGGRAVRRYHIDDRFDGEAQHEKRFPVLDDDGRELCRVSAEDIAARADLRRLVAQRRDFRGADWPELAANWEHSVFYQTDLSDAAREYAARALPLPRPLPDSAPVLIRMHDAMFRSEALRLQGRDGSQHEAEAFATLRDALTADALLRPQQPAKAVYDDQIVWARSPARIDIAGGWTDTPPTCLMEGGDVVNLAIELNGQPPLQAYVRPCHERHIICRSIDLGAAETITTFDELSDFARVGSPFSIPKAALALAGFLPQFCRTRYATLKDQLDDFGCGIEMTMMSAIPAGSGLGTSSILAATVLGALADFCRLGWDKNEICHRTLILEQLLTTGGGWQDQYGGVLHGVKLLQTARTISQQPTVRWLPDDLYTGPDYAPCHLLYYTGITRTAKDLLQDIVRRMFLNHGPQLRLIRQMKAQALDMHEAIARRDFQAMGRLVRTTWQQNQALDAGTNPAAVRAITDLIDDLCLGYKLPGAGGGGYIYMVAKDPEAAARIRTVINAHRPNTRARFVEMTLSRTGLQTSRS